MQKTFKSDTCQKILKVYVRSTSMVCRNEEIMKISVYLQLDKLHRKKLLTTDIRNLGIGVVGLILFSGFILNLGLCTIDKSPVFVFYLTCFIVAQSFYISPLITVYEERYVSIFKKYKNVPIDKHLFLQSKYILLTKFSLLFVLPVQLLHFAGLVRTDTALISVTGFWPILAMAASLLVQLVFVRIMARELWR